MVGGMHREYLVVCLGVDVMVQTLTRKLHPWNFECVLGDLLVTLQWNLVIEYEMLIFALPFNKQ